MKTYNDIYIATRNALRGAGIESYMLEARVLLSTAAGKSSQELLPFLDGYLSKGIRHVLCTDISKDGMLQGPATPLYQTIMQAYPDCQLIASGGVSSIEDIRALAAAGIPAVVFGKAIYEGKINLKELIQEFPQI